VTRPRTRPPPRRAHEDLRPRGAPPPLLVVVADDAGVDVPRNRGIVDAIHRGVVRAVSVLAVGRALDDLVRRLDALPSAMRPDVGLHLALTEGLAVAGPAEGLTDARGRLLGDKRRFWRAALAGDVRPDAVRREVEAQLDRLAAVGLAATRVDGHQHVHALPGVREGLAAALAGRPEVRHVRLGRPLAAPHDRRAVWPRLARRRVTPPWRGVDREGHRAQAALGTLFDEARPALVAGRGSADVLAGIDLVAGYSADDLVAELRAARDALASVARAPGAVVDGAPGAVRRWASVVELMTHPGLCDGASTRFSSLDARRIERDALCDDALPGRIAALGFRAGRFADLDATPPVDAATGAAGGADVGAAEGAAAGAAEGAAT
jgi:predicted glycoside hydrolase/deacetylase ChbG (UPF0249 family)